LFALLKSMYEKNEDLSEYAQLLYEQAALMAGLTIEDPAAYALKITELMLKAKK